MNGRSWDWYGRQLVALVRDAVFAFAAYLIATRGTLS